MASLNRKCRNVYQQDIIWWVHLYKSFPELRYDPVSSMFRCVEEFMVDGPDQTKKLTKAMKSYVHAKKCRNLAGSGKFKIPKDHKFNVLIRGFLGKLPKSDDIRATVGENYDLMSAFQTYFLY